MKATPLPASRGSGYCESASMRVHDRIGRRELGRDPVVVRHDDVDPARSGRRDLGTGARPAVDRDDDRDALGDRSIDRGDRQPVALLQSARHVRLHVDAEPAEGDDEDREPIEPVRIEVPEHHHPLVAVAGPGETFYESVRVRQEMGIMQPGERLGEPRDEVVSPEDAPTRQQRRHPLGQAMVERGGHEIGVDVTGLWEAPAKARLEHRVRMPRSGHLRLNRASPAGLRQGDARVRTRLGGRGARGSHAGEHDADPPTHTNRPGADWQRRSTSTSRSRCRSAGPGRSR